MGCDSFAGCLDHSHDASGHSLRRDVVARDDGEVADGGGLGHGRQAVVGEALAASDGQGGQARQGGEGGQARDEWLGVRRPRRDLRELRGHVEPHLLQEGGVPGGAQKAGGVAGGCA